MSRCAIVAGVTLSLASALAQNATGAEKEEDEVRRLANTFLAMVRTEDPTPLEKIGDLLAEDFIQSTSHGTVVRGREANLAWMKTAVDEIADLFERFDYQLEIKSVKVYGQSAVLFGKITLSGTLKNAQGGFTRRIWETMVFEKTPNGWKLAHEHSTRVKDA